MRWTDYVGERFKSNKRIYEAESYDSVNGFILREVGNPANRICVRENQLGNEYRMVIDCEPPKPYKSIRDEREGWNLLDRILLNSAMEVPVKEQVKHYLENGFSHWDIYLTMKAVEILGR